MPATIEKVVFPKRFEMQKKRVCAYARVSVNNEDMLHSLSAQVGYYLDYIGSHPDWQFAGVFHDKPTTGTKEERPQFIEMINKCRNGEIDMIVTKSIARFARNTITTLKYTRELKRLGVDVYFEEERIHTLSSEGEFLLTMFAAYAQAQSYSDSENCKWRIRRKFEEGQMTPVTMLGYDFKNNTLCINRKEANIVRLIFQLYLEGYGYPTIAKELNRKGMHTKNGNEFGTNEISIILRNEKYYGVALLQKWYSADHLSKKKIANDGVKDQFLVTESHEPIIDEATFLKVQDELVRRAKKHGPKKPAATYPFTSKIKCGTCGDTYRRKMNAAGTKYEKAVWICTTYNSKGKKACPSKFIPENILIEETTKVLGLGQFNEDIFQSRISGIKAYNDCRLVFEFTDGTKEEIQWQHKSRADSWTPDMKKAAAKTKKRGLENGKCNSN